MNKRRLIKMAVQDTFNFEEFAEQPSGTPKQLPTHKASSVRLPDPDGARQSGVVPLAPAQSTWEEVPQARFLSWTAGEQYAYCAERDRDAAEFALTYDEAMFYLNRAERYEELLNEDRAKDSVRS